MQRAVSRSSRRRRRAGWRGAAGGPGRRGLGWRPRSPPTSRPTSGNRPRRAAEVRDRARGTGRRVRKASAVSISSTAADQPSVGRSSRTAMRMCSVSRPRSSVGRTAMPVLARAAAACRPGTWPGRSSRRRGTSWTPRRLSCVGEPLAAGARSAAISGRSGRRARPTRSIAASASALTGHAWRRRVEALRQLGRADQVARAQARRPSTASSGSAARRCRGVPDDARLRCRRRSP